jgi:hypothetical protein
VSAFDWVVLFGAPRLHHLWNVAGGGTRDLHGHLLAGRSLPVRGRALRDGDRRAQSRFPTPGQGFVARTALRPVLLGRRSR